MEAIFNRCWVFRGEKCGIYKPKLGIYTPSVIRTGTLVHSLGSMNLSPMIQISRRSSHSDATFFLWVISRMVVDGRFSDEDVWLTQAQLAEIYDTTQENISMHIKNIYKDAELQEDRTYKDFLLVRQEGKRSVQRNIAHLQNRN